MAKSFLYKRSNSPYWYYGWVDSSGTQRGESTKKKTRPEAEVVQNIKDKQRVAIDTNSIVAGVPWIKFEKEFLETYSGKTLEAYTSACAHFRNIVKPTTVSALTYNDAKNFKTGLSKYTYVFRKKTKDSLEIRKPLKPNSINIYLRPLHTAFAEAVRMGYATKNIFEEVEQINVTKRVPRYMTLDQVRRLKDIARESPHQDIYLMLLFLIYTGVRKQEMMNLRWSAIDLDREMMYLHGSETWEPKDREEHAIGLHADLVEALKKRGRTSPYIFPGKNGLRDKHSIGRLFNRLYRRAGIEVTGLHIIRHTFATHFQGAEKTLQRVLGHSDPATTQRYRHVTPEDLQSVKNAPY